MKLKDDLELVAFFKDVKYCQADVWLITERKSRLNLKSFLTQCILIAMPDKQKVISKSSVECEEIDEKRLKKWCKE